MAITRNHGGDCCGARHIYTFRNDDVTNTQSLVDETAGVSGAGNNLLAEVILSNRQTENNPQLIAKLAALGYVYTDAWVGNHGTPVHRFSRTGRRLALQNNRFNWPGMYAGPTLEGDMPVVHPAAPDGPVASYRDFTVQQLVGTLTRGSRHRVVNRNSNIYNEIVTVRTYSRYNPTEVYLDNGRRFRVSSLGPVTPNEGQVQPLQRHRNAAPVRENQAPRVVLSEVFASFQDGRIRGPFATVAECREAYPRVARYVTREVMSNGTTVTSDPTRFAAR